MERERDKPQLVRVGSLIRYNLDGDIGIVTKIIIKPSLEDDAVQPIKVWWFKENIERKAGVLIHEFEPWGAAETVLRY